jgi:membrane associated rhomboid family serine protease
MLTDMFLHGGWMHLIFNMWFLWIFGPAMEARFGRPGFLALYVIGGIIANIGSQLPGSRPTPSGSYDSALREGTKVV